MSVKVAILTGFGINCDRETAAVFEMAGATSERIHVNRLVNGEVNLQDYHIMAVPGGFSFVDHLAPNLPIMSHLLVKLLRQRFSYLYNWVT